MKKDNKHVKIDNNIQKDYYSNKLYRFIKLVLHKAVNPIVTKTGNWCVPIKTR